MLDASAVHPATTTRSKALAIQRTNESIPDTAGPTDAARHKRTEFASASPDCRWRVRERSAGSAQMTPTYHAHCDAVSLELVRTAESLLRYVQRLKLWATSFVVLAPFLVDLTRPLSVVDLISSMVM